MTSVIPVPLETRISEGLSSENVEQREVAHPQLIGPNITVTTPTDTTPGGRIFEDTIRGTIFWEALDLSDDAGEKEKDKTSWGNIFQVEWIKW